MTDTEQQVPASEAHGESATENEPPPEDLPIALEFVYFLRENKKWWLIPIVIMALLLGSLLLLSTGPVAPFIYTLF